MSLTTAAALTLLKPVATAACLRSGATGGLLTPSLATGALLGIAAGQVWQDLWPGGQPGAFAFIAAGAMLAVTQRAPLCAIALVLELTHTGYPLLVPLAIAVTAALVTDHQLSARSAAPAVSRTGEPREGAAGPVTTSTPRR
jgi:H+/Cl- antiporter ClcA